MLCTAAWVLVIVVGGNPVPLCGYPSIEACREAGDVWKKASDGRGFTCIPMTATSEK